MRRFAAHVRLLRLMQLHNMWNMLCSHKNTHAHKINILLTFTQIRFFCHKLNTHRHTESHTYMYTQMHQPTFASTSMPLSPSLLRAKFKDRSAWSYQHVCQNVFYKNVLYNLWLQILLHLASHTKHAYIHHTQRYIHASSHAHAHDRATAWLNQCTHLSRLKHFRSAHHWSPYIISRQIDFFDHFVFGQRVE